MTTPIECECGNEDFYPYCKIHVICDEDCRALVDPSTLLEWVNSSNHWRNHPSLSGCSHGN